MAMMDESGEASDHSIDSLEYMLRLVSRNKQTIIVKSPDGSTVFCCIECPMKYADKHSMELHLCMHNKEFRFICTICGTGLKRKEHLERHTLGHQEVRPHVCGDCGKAFKRKEHLTIHRAIHSGQKDLSCPLCDRSFHRKDHLQKHLQSHSNKFRRHGKEVDDSSTTIEIKSEAPDDDDYEDGGDGDEVVTPIITCVSGNALDPDALVKLELLQKSFESEREVEQSFCKSEDPERPFGCLICHKTYKRKDHMKLHSRTHLRKDHVCSECGKAYHRPEELLYHMNEHVTAASLLESGAGESSPARAQPLPSLKQPPWLANTSLSLPESSLLVPRTFPSKDPSDRAHECPVCHKRFKRKQHLKVHSNVHTKRLLSIWCSLCNEGFQTNDQFESHECMMLNSEQQNTENINDSHSLNNVLDNSTDDSYHGKQEQELDDVEQPVDQRDGGARIERDARAPCHIPVPQKVFVCKFCQKPFRRRDHYRIHLNIHTGHKSFFCPDCGKGFYRKDHLQKHLPVHSRVKKPSGGGGAGGGGVKRAMPVLIPISMVPAKKTSTPRLLPEITIHAPSNAKLRVPLQMKVPYEVITCTEDGEHRALVNPNSNNIYLRD